VVARPRLQGDSRPASCRTYVINALQTVVPGVGANALPLLQPAQPPIETVLTMLLNDLSAGPNDIDLVLDDYHVVAGLRVRAGMVFLLEHRPPQGHLVVSTRADAARPSLPVT
jgi:ATP/maltotriose-dependent transcriptional regulator MalT